jgi:hypothetical protein
MKTTSFINRRFTYCLFIILSAIFIKKHTLQIIYVKAVKPVITDKISNDAISKYTRLVILYIK